jgi:putative flippase GtrA
VLFTLTELFGVWYVISVAAGFVTSTILIFILQKYWTFHDDRTREAPRQAWLFSLVELSSLLLHVGGVYMMVEWLGFWYGLAQIIVMVISTFYTFLTKKFLIFNR